MTVRVRRWLRNGLVLAVGGGAIVALAASTLSAKAPTTIPPGTSTGQPIAALVLTWTTRPGPLTATLTIGSTGGGTVTWTAAADDTYRPVATTGSVDGPCSVTASTATKFVCPSLHATGATSVFTFPGLKVNSHRAAGMAMVGAVASNGTSTWGSSPVPVASYTDVATTPPVFVTGPASASGGGLSATFTAGVHGSTWVRVHGPQVFLSLVGAPSWLTIGTHSGLLSGTPPTGTTGTYTFTVVADTTAHPTRPHSGNLEAKEKFTLRVVG